MLKALSAMLVPEDEHRVLIQRMYKECVPLWVTNIPITVVIADVTVSFSSDFRSTTAFASLDIVFDRTRDLRELEESMERYEPKFIPATKSSIEALEKVTLDSLDEAAASFTCGICQEGLDQLKAVEEEEDHGDIKPRTTITRLPCLHIYHDTCIVQWLKISHLCPLCRHALPTVEVGEQRNPA
ncbi:putative transcription factor C2H2 family [Rosa chinensis]|uniref:RING-type E3 ubiquitin transferase n=1 Tax=Rosa chinensis TaxID=74649 RepID=A0A2P6P629_ROSCH|nr:putative transcription factor C2H2 family [Rosa chinensis]